MGEIIAIALIGLIIGGAVLYVVKAKKSGSKCIGCPNAKHCPSRNPKNGCNCCGEDK